MSYERRLEIEALPAEEGWGKWLGIIGLGTTHVERKQLVPVMLWIATANGPKQVEAYRYQKWQFVKDERWLAYTVWHTNYDYTDYSLKATSLYSLCADSRDELCQKAQLLISGALQDLRKAVAIQESSLEKFL
jgi:hypothetical protein